MYQNPYENLNGGFWMKTNFHTHAGTGEGTCGRFPVDFVVDLYRELNYSALCISNHNIYTDTHDFEDENLVMVQGVEYTGEPHMLNIGVNKTLHELSHQEAINETLKQGGFSVLCHPNWMYKNYWPLEDIDALKGYAGIEVVNMLIYRLSGSGLASDVWDYLLKQGKLVFGFGNDDFHMPFDAGRSYTDIYVNGRSFTDIKQAIDEGRFTASTGLSLEYLNVTDGSINVKAKFPKITYIENFNYKFITENGTVKESFGQTAEYKINNEKYIRVEVIAENGAMLFTQPIYNPEFFKKP